MEKDDLGQIYSEIESIENKIGNLQGELKNLKTKLEIFVQKKETLKEEYTIDPALEKELTAPITGSYEIITEPTTSTQQEEISKPKQAEVKPSIQSKISNSQKVEIIRPSLTTNIPPKKEQVTANSTSYSKTETPTNYQDKQRETPPDILEDFKNWIKSKIGNIPVEEFLGINLLNKIGLLLLVVGFSYFLRLAYDWIGPFTKIIGMLVLSALVFWSGDKLYRNKSYSIFGLGMIASSFALFYFTVYASYNIEATRILEPDQTLLGFILLLIASVFVIGSSLKYKKETLTSFAYFLGFLTISINDKSDFNYFSMASAGILAVSLIGIMTVMRWKYLAGVGIFASYANYWLYADGLPRNANGYLLTISETGQNYYLESILYLLFFWIIFLISTFTMKVEDKKSERICSGINIINAFSFFGMLSLVRPEPTEWGPFTLNMGMGIVYIIGAFVGRKFEREFLWKSSIVLGISLITLAIPSKFSEYGHVFGWLLEGSALIILGFLYKESYVKNLGYLVLLLNLGRFFTLPYGDFFYSSTVAYPLISFELNRGMIYIFLLIIFYGLIPFIRKYISEWSVYDKIVYNVLGVLASLTLFLFSFYLVQKPFQAYIIIPVASFILFLSVYLKNRNLYYSSASITCLSLIGSMGLLFQNKTMQNEVHAIISLVLILLGNALQYYPGKEKPILNRYMQVKGSMNKREVSSSLVMKRLFLNGEVFLWIAGISFVGLILNNVTEYAHTVCLLLVAYAFFSIDKKYKQGVKQAIALFGLAFIVSLFRYGVFRDNRPEEFSKESWIALSNTATFWVSGVGILYWKDKFNLKIESEKILSPLLVSATTLIAMMIGDILVDKIYLLSFAAIYSLALVISFQKLKENFCVYNSLLLSWFSLLLGLGGMIVRKESPEGISEYMNLVTYFTSSIAATGLIFYLLTDFPIRVISYLQSLLSSVCFILIVIPEEYRPIAFSILHLGHLVFLFRFKVDSFYEYSYLTLGFATLVFLNQTNFPSSAKFSDHKSISLISGYSLLSVIQTVYIFWKTTKTKDRYLYYILNFIIILWSIHITMPINFGILLFAILVCVNSILLARFRIKEIEMLYYYPLSFSIFSFLYLLFSNKPNVIEEMDYKGFALGLLTLFLLLRSVKEAENYKAQKPDFKEEKYSFERITMLILFLEFILLTMTVVNVSFWSLIWTMEALCFIIYGIYKNYPLIRYSGIGLIGLAVIKVAFWDLRNLPENTRVIVLISIGGLFVGGSFLYSKYKDKLFEKDSIS